MAASGHAPWAAAAASVCVAYRFGAAVYVSVGYR